MTQMPAPAAETERLAALYALEVLDTPPEPEFDALVQAAALACAAPVARLALVDAQRVWFKAGVGLAEVGELPRELTCCDIAILGSDLFEVADAALDSRFADSPVVRGGPGRRGLRFYAGMPLRLRDGHLVGTLCVLDHEPRRLSESQAGVLRLLALAAALALQGRRTELERPRQCTRTGAPRSLVAHAQRVVSFGCVRDRRTGRMQLRQPALAADFWAQSGAEPGAWLAGLCASG